MGITLAEVNEWESKVQSGDRAGAYLEIRKRYEQIGASDAAIEQLLIQAQITSYGGFWGGAAIAGNAYAQQNAGADENGVWRYDVTLDTFSVQIVERLIEGIERDLDRAAGNEFAPFATPENKQVEAMMVDLIKGPLAVHKFKFYVTDPATGKREVKEIGG